MTVPCVSSRNAVVGMPTPLTLCSAIVPVTGTPACNRSPGFASSALTVKFVAPGCTWPSTATMVPE